MKAEDDGVIWANYVQHVLYYIITPPAYWLLIVKCDFMISTMMYNVIYNTI